MGHFCKICGRIKANEKFSGKGHGKHICKACSRISPSEQLEIMHMNTISELQDTRKGRRQLELFIHGKKYSERTKAYARKHKEWFKKERVLYKSTALDKAYNGIEYPDQDVSCFGECAICEVYEYWHNRVIEENKSSER